LIENEVILLRNVYDHIGEMVNWSLMDIHGEDPTDTKDSAQSKPFKSARVAKPTALYDRCESSRFAR